MNDMEEALVDGDAGKCVASLSGAEYAELARLVDAELKGEDVEYAAFSSLCPTMEEGEFDADACEVYRRLREEDMIEGEFDGDGFYFIGLTPAGRELVARCEEGREGVSGAEWAQLVERSDALDDVSGQIDKNVGLDKLGFPASGKGALLLIVACLLAGFVAGIGGGMLGARLFAL